MMKFAIDLTKGDQETILALFNRKEDAMAAGPVFREQYSRDMGLISCIQADFDEEGCRTDGGFRLYGCWQ